MKKYLSAFAAVLVFCTCVLSSAALPVAAVGENLDDVFQRELDFLDAYYTLGPELMISTMCDVLYPWDEAEANDFRLKPVDAATFEKELNLYFAPTADHLAGIRNYLVYDPTTETELPFYDAETDTYRLFCMGGFGGSMPPRQYKGYVATENGYTVYYQHITYDFLEYTDEVWDELEALDWPEFYVHNGKEYQNGPDGYYRIVSLDNYGNKYEVQYTNGILRILSQTPYVDANPGDANGDGKVNNRDLGMLQQHLNDMEITVDATALDLNGDGKVNNRDLGMLQRMLNE